MYKKKKRGQSAIEWGILIPFLILIISSVLELSPLMSNIIIVDKSTQYAASTAAKKGTSNSTIAYNYAMNMQGLMKFSDFLAVDPSIDGCNGLELTDAPIHCLALRDEDFVPSTQRKNELNELVVSPSVSTISATNEDGLIVEELTITPGFVDDRFSGMWVSITGRHEYKILTPLLQAVLGGACDSEHGNQGVFINACNYFPITKTTIYRVE